MITLFASIEKDKNSRGKGTKSIL